MIQSNTEMSELALLDKVYARLQQYASVNEKIRYCSSLINRTESFAASNTEGSTEHITVYSREIIERARKELQSLLEKENSI